MSRTHARHENFAWLCVNCMVSAGIPKEWIRARSTYQVVPHECWVRLDVMGLTICIKEWSDDPLAMISQAMPKLRAFIMHLWGEPTEQSTAQTRISTEYRAVEP